MMQLSFYNFCFSLIALAVILNTPLLFNDLKMTMHQFNPVHGTGDDVRQQSKNASGIKWVR